MKKVFLTALSLAFTFGGLTSCDDSASDSNTLPVIIANVNGSTAGLTRVAAMYTTNMNFKGTLLPNPGSGTEAASAAFSSGVTLELPMRVTGVDFKEMTQTDFGGDVVLNKESFRGAFVYFQGYADADPRGYFTLVNTSSMVTERWFYSDTAVTIKGTSVSEEGTEYVYDLNIIIGWNRFFIKSETVPVSGEGESEVAEHQKRTIQTAIFEGVNTTWYYIADAIPAV